MWASTLQLVLYINIILIICNFRMTSDAAYAYDSLACHIDLLGYQGNEITDSVCKFVNVQSPLLVEGLLLCNYNLPVNNQDFKLFLRQFYQSPLDLLWKLVLTTQ